MAVAELNVSHRALLGAAFVSPAAAVPGSSAVDARRLARWERAVARFRGAEGALAAVAHLEDDAVYDPLLGRFSAALKALLRAPAADAGRWR